MSIEVVPLCWTVRQRS